jgi:hypothetical protein
MHFDHFRDHESLYIARYKSAAAFPRLPGSLTLSSSVNEVSIVFESNFVQTSVFKVKTGDFSSRAFGKALEGRLPSSSRDDKIFFRGQNYRKSVGKYEDRKICGL